MARFLNMQIFSQKIRSEAGFSLLEMIITIIVLSIITTSVTPFIQVQIDSYVHGLEAKYASQTIRLGMDRALSEIRRAQSTGTINTATQSEFDFTNTDGDRIEITYGTFTANGNSSPSLMFRVVGGADPMPLIYDVSECTFTYLTGSGNTTTTPANIRVVQIALTVEDEGTGSTFHIANQVAPDNFSP